MGYLIITEIISTIIEDDENKETLDSLDIFLSSDKGKTMVREVAAMRNFLS